METHPLARRRPRTICATIPHDTKEARETCGARIAARRKARGLTQDELGRLVGSSGKPISTLELGKRWVRVDLLLKIAYVLDLAPWDLFPPPPNAPAAACLRLLPHLSSEQQTWLVKLLEPLLHPSTA